MVNSLRSIISKALKNGSNFHLVVNSLRSIISKALKTVVNLKKNNMHDFHS